MNTTECVSQLSELSEKIYEKELECLELRRKIQESKIIMGDKEDTHYIDAIQSKDSAGKQLYTNEKMRDIYIKSALKDDKEYENARDVVDKTTYELNKLTILIERMKRNIELGKLFLQK